MQFATRAGMSMKIVDFVCAPEHAARVSVAFLTQRFGGSGGRSRRLDGKSAMRANAAKLAVLQSNTGPPETDTIAT